MRTSRGDSGATAGTSQPEYSLDLSPLSLSFDWRMPKRFGDKLDQWGLPVIPNTNAYARPNPTTVGWNVVPQFPVQLDASGSPTSDDASA